MDTKLVGIASLGIGSLFVYAGFRGFSILKAAQNVIRGTSPMTGQTEIGLALPGSQSGSPGQTLPGPGPGVGSHSGATWSPGELRNLWLMNGGSPATAQNAVCHAMQESSGNAMVTSSNPDGGTNVGLWQLDTRGVGAGHTIAQLQDPNLNCRLTIRATGNGRNWSEWATPGC